MKSILILFIASLSLSLCAQPNGSKTVYNYDGTVYSVRQYSNGKKAGTWIVNNRDSSQTIEVYKDDSLRSFININGKGDTVVNQKYQYEFLAGNKLHRTYIYKNGILSVKRLHNYRGMDSIVERLDSTQAFKVTYHIDSAKNKAKDKAGMIPNTKPEFKGGTDELVNFIGNNLNYPSDARKAGIQGKIVVRFVVETDGTISNIKIEEGPSQHPSLEKEAIRVLRKTNGMWIPGTVNGKIVKSMCQIPILFQLE